MKLLLSSDLHYGTTPASTRACEALAERVASETADVLLLVGDLASSPTALGRCLSLFSAFRGVRLAVPGNHDVWVGGQSRTDSWQLHEILLPALLEEFGFHALHQHPFALGGVAFVGSMGWYDYSLRDDIGIALEHYRNKIYPGDGQTTWNDRRYARFPMDDPELTRLLLDRLQGQLEQVDGCQDVVAIVHHVVSRRLLFHPRVLVPKVWRFLNAFLGSEAFGELLLADPRVKLVACGHIHRARTVTLNGRILTTIGSDYSAKELVRATPTSIVSRQVVR